MCPNYQDQQCETTDEAVTVGKVVLSIVDRYEDERYEVIEINGRQAKIKAINPTGTIYQWNLSVLRVCKTTVEEVQQKWRNKHGI